MESFLQCLSAIPIPLKVEPKLENVVLKLAAETMTMWILPLSVDYLEGNILRERERTQGTGWFILQKITTKWFSLWLHKISFWISYIFKGLKRYMLPMILRPSSPKQVTKRTTTTNYKIKQTKQYKISSSAWTKTKATPWN